MRAVAFATLIGTGLLVSPVLGLDDGAPFGFSWGPIEKIPRPSLATREGNLTLLIYHKDRLPSDELQDTDEIVLEVCNSEGLQQVIWVSRPLSDGEMHNKIKAIAEEGARRYGTASQSRQEVISWNQGRTRLRSITDTGFYRVLMTSTGPAFDSCAKEHDTVTGPPMSDHWNRHFLESGTQ